ncbi:MAG: hypothetical protein R3331_07315 [Sulfurospirillaceae bacterium]|nr:hypothetical protein [Sulfurospirillaceae bacterium]
MKDKEINKIIEDTENANANGAIFIENYLTTAGNEPHMNIDMIQKAGYKIAKYRHE